MASSEHTSNEIKCDSYLYFSFYSDYFDTDNVTKKLEIEPTSVIMKKEPVPKSTSWNFQINAGSDIDLETPLAKMLDIFEPKIDVINQLKKEYTLNTTLRFVIDIDIHPDSPTPYFGLNKKAIYFLDRTETEVDFDVYQIDRTPFGIRPVDL